MTIIRARLLCTVLVAISPCLPNAPPALAIECNPNNCPPDGCQVTGNDCQPNDVDDDVDIAGGTSQDCNGNRIPDECELAECVIDVVFLLDTSNSVELEMPAMCDAIEHALDQVETEGICVRSEKLALVPGQDVPCTESFCCEGNAYYEYGAVACEYFDVEAQDCGGCGDGSCEDWAPATAVVAAEKDWTPGPRIIVPISDEGPRCGGGPQIYPPDPIDDADCVAIHHAIPAVWDNRVIVAPVVPLGGAVETLARKLANGGAPGGQVFDISDINLGTKLADFIRGTCPGDCNSNNVPDDCDIDDGLSRDCDKNRIPDACQDSPDCQDPPNGVADACDISCGVSGGPCNVGGCGNSTDCDNNCVPDECDDPVDCNNNGVQDSCDIDDGTSLDCGGGEASDCCTVRDNEMGCDDPFCEGGICVFKPSCCEQAWTRACVNLAANYCSPLCNPLPNGIPDECQAELGPDCDGDGVPDACELHCGATGGGCGQPPGCGEESDCNQNCVPDECESQNDCQPNGVQDICDIAAGTSEDCNANDVPDECDISGPTSEDCNINGVADECEVGECQAGDDDCNNNETPDVCDIYAGTSVDCNENLVPDECDIPPDPWNNWSNDCNSNGTPDECESNEDCQGNCIRDICDIYSGTSFDCNNNFVPDACDILLGISQDANQNGIPDECECPAPDAPEAPPSEGLLAGEGYAKNRYISFVPANPGQMTAIRVTLTEFVNDDPEGPIGSQWWVGNPKEFCENSGKRKPPCPEVPGLPDTFMGAALQCSPYYKDYVDWHGVCEQGECVGGLKDDEPCDTHEDCLGVLHVYGQATVPSDWEGACAPAGSLVPTTYEIQVVEEGCYVEVESNFSVPLEVTMSHWGDIVGIVDEGWTPPDGCISIPNDVTAALDKFRNLGPPDLPYPAVIMARADLDLETPNQLIDISDATCVMDAFRGFPYRYGEPQACQEGGGGGEPPPSGD